MGVELVAHGFELELGEMALAADVLALHVGSVGEVLGEGDVGRDHKDDESD